MKEALQDNYGPFLLLGTVLLYCLLYAPYGINETDGGFITAYTWRLFNGEWPYLDFIYVRPPMSLFIRYVEMLLLPEGWEVIGERWLFYGKIALANYLGAAILTKGNYKWWLATLGFLFSTHNYPAAAWHTVDGVWLGALSLYCLFQSDRWLFPAALATVFAMLCKQSFYPMAPVFLFLLWILKPWRLAIRGTLLLGIIGLVCIGLFYATGTWHSFVQMSTGATTPRQLWEYGILAMLKVDVRLLVVSTLLLPYLFGFRLPYLLYLFVASLVGFYALQVYTHDYWIPPLKVSRLLWLLALIYGILRLGQLIWKQVPWRDWGAQKAELAALFGLLALSWMTAISWGYNFPLFLSVPYFYVLGKVTPTVPAKIPVAMQRGIRVALLLAMILVFRYGYATIYRDEPRAEHSCNLGTVFPKLQGIKSSPQTCALYTDVKQLADKYGPNFKTVPAFPLANYLTDTRSPWPIDWATSAEIKGVENQIYEAMEQPGIHYFVEKSYGDVLLENDKFATTKYLMQSMRKVEETEFFEVYVKE